MSAQMSDAPAGTTDAVHTDAQAAQDYAHAERERRIAHAHRLARFGRISRILGAAIALVALLLWIFGVVAGAGVAVPLFVGVVVLGTGLVVGFLAARTGLVRVSDGSD